MFVRAMVKVMMMMGMGMGTVLVMAMMRQGVHELFRHEQFNDLAVYC